MTMGFRLSGIKRHDLMQTKHLLRVWMPKGRMPVYVGEKISLY